jgi:hypothetical protein
MIGILSLYSSMETEGRDTPIFIKGADSSKAANIMPFYLNNKLTVFKNDKVIWDGYIGKDFPNQKDNKGIEFDLTWCKEEYPAVLA